MKILIQPLDTQTWKKLKREFLNQPLDTKNVQRNEDANKDVEHIESMQNSLVFLGFEAHHDVRSDFNTYDGQRDRGYKHFSQIHLENPMFF